MSDCIFCKIVAGEIPSSKVYEDDTVFAFLDNNPVARGHTLVIPKKHATDVFDVDEEALQAVTSAAKKLAHAARKGLGADGVNIMHASGKAAQQSVFHLHFHVVPRSRGDGIDAWPHHKHGKKDFQEVAKQIRDAL